MLCLLFHSSRFPKLAARVSNSACVLPSYKTSPPFTEIPHQVTARCASRIVGGARQVSSGFSSNLNQSFNFSSYCILFSYYPRPKFPAHCKYNDSLLSLPLTVTFYHSFIHSSLHPFFPHNPILSFPHELNQHLQLSIRPPNNKGLPRAWPNPDSRNTVPRPFHLFLDGG